MKVATVTDLGNLVHEARLAAGLTQGQLARLAGASRLWVNQVESGHQGASVGKVLNLLAALDLAVDVTPEQRRPSRLDSLRQRRAGHGSVTPEGSDG
jgi:transcriptional regulator with XRE-family HTH domain